jgi:regulator of nonsense transcripts 2
VVLRQEEQLDPEAEADFDRAFEKMMSESLDSRKFERRSQFDVPLPIRKIQRQPQEPTEDEPKPPVESEPNTMAFSLMTKKGNRQQASSSHDLFHMKCNPPSLTLSQTKTIELPSDSSFAVAMKSQQAAEREEQQRIKNLVLNYDLREDDQHDGIPNDSPYGPIVQTPLQRNSYTKRPKSGLDHYNPPLSRAEKSGRFAPRSRRLNLSDVDWYGTKNVPARGPGSRSENRTASASPARKQSQNAKKSG